MSEEFITMKEAMEFLGVSKAKMSRLAKDLAIYEDARDKRKRWVKKGDIEKLKRLYPRGQLSFDDSDSSLGLDS